MGNVIFEGRAADNGRAEERWIDPKIFAERQHREAALRRGAKQAVHILDSEPAVGECAVYTLRHQVDRRKPLGDLTEIGFRDTDERGAGAPQAVHHALSSGTKTG